MVKPCGKKLLQLWSKTMGSQSVARPHMEVWKVPARIKGSLQDFNGPVI